MWTGNEKTSLKVLADFRASSNASLSLSLSADGRWLAYGDGDSVFIGKWNNRPPHLTDVTEGPNISNLRALEWSPDSKYLLVASDRIVYLVEPDHPSRARSFAELEELTIETILWSYDSEFAVVADCCGAATVVFGVRGAVHWLPGVRRIRGKPLWALSRDCQTLAVCAYLSQVGDCLLAFSCGDWTLLWKVQSKCALVSGVAWFPNSSAVLVWDSVARFCVDFFYPDGSSKLTMSPAKATDHGVCTISVSPCSSLLALLDDNLQVHLYNTLIWRLVSVFDMRKLTRREGDPPPPAPPAWSPSPLVCWSFCSRYLAFASSESSHLVLWSKINGDFLQSNVGEGAITDMTWHERKPVLAVACGRRQLYLLRFPVEESSSAEVDMCKIKSSSNVKEIRWAGPRSSYLVVRESKGHAALTCIR